LILMEGLSSNKKKRVIAMLDGINKKENKTNGEEVKEETSQETKDEEIKIGLTD